MLCAPFLPREIPKPYPTIVAVKLVPMKVAILSKNKRLFSGFTNADNVSNLDKLRKPNAQARLEYGCEFV